MTDQNDLIIIQNVLAGHSAAFATLVNKYKDMAVTLAYNILLNQEDAEEVAQDAFVKVYTSLHSFKADAKFSTWLYRIVLNTALNKKKLKKYYTVEISEAVSDELPFYISDTLAREITDEHRKHIQFALRSLSENERICITLYYLNELSVEEVHELTSITRSNIKILLHRGRKNLYKSFYNHLKGELTNLI